MPAKQKPRWPEQWAPTRKGNAPVRCYEKQRIKAVRRCYDRFKVMPLDQLRGLPRLRSFETAYSGVYFLWFGPEIVYIGQSQWIGPRIRQHAIDGKEFTHATYERGHRECLRELESDYVRKYTPRLNLTSTG